jgi:diaminohydroxyphosphoribosylaminopyrimidine deaminase/5-amino-6-(5-phosphoribosylamino)uracil reductase
VSPKPAADPAFDLAFMDRALALAQAQLGQTAPNPSVGCVIVRQGAVIAEAVTGVGGRPHAEEIALETLGGMARDATAYVTLEPCFARSSGAPGCSSRLIEARLARVVIACLDPHPTAKGGVERLRAAGIEVETGLREAEALYLNRGFFKWVETGRPWVTLDGSLASHDAEFTLCMGESYPGALDRMGREGLTRVRVRPGTALATQLRGAGLVDETT